MTLLLVGLVFGAPLMIPTICVEGTDSFDAISRSMSYVYARPWRYIWCKLVALVYGIPCAIDARFSVQDFWDRCRYYGATMTFTLGAMHIFLWQQPEQPNDADNPIRSAGMVPMPPALAAARIWPEEARRTISSAISPFITMISNRPMRPR